VNVPSQNATSFQEEILDPENTKVIEGRITGVIDQRVIVRMGAKKRILHVVDPELVATLMDKCFQDVQLEVNDDAVVAIKEGHE
jgi:hypothetical protein